MTEQECIENLERISAALDTCGSLAEARALRDERKVWVKRRHEARALAEARTKFLCLMDARSIQIVMVTALKNAARTQHMPSWRDALQRLEARIRAQYTIPPECIAVAPSGLTTDIGEE